MSMVEVRVDDEEFQLWLKRTERAFVYMIETMLDVARVIGENTQPITPFRYGTLSKSFKWHILTNNSRMKVLQLEMSAINQKDGYNYAWIQHENYSYNHRYGKKAQYLYWGIIDSEEMAYELIEEDYLSLFSRGYIF